MASALDRCLIRWALLDIVSDITYNKKNNNKQ